jgi:hypothetical protein
VVVPLPSLQNYYIGKGNIFMKPVDTDDDAYVHVGNCPQFAAPRMKSWSISLRFRLCPRQHPGPGFELTGRGA